MTVQLGAEKDIPAVVAALHDWWIDLESLAYDQSRATLTLVLYEHSDGTGSDGAGVRTLQILRVMGYGLIDNEQVRFYDLNRIKCVGNRLTSVCGVPLEIEVDVAW